MFRDVKYVYVQLIRLDNSIKTELLKGNYLYPPCAWNQALQKQAHSLHPRKYIVNCLTSLSLNASTSCQHKQKSSEIHESIKFQLLINYCFTFVAHSEARKQRDERFHVQWKNVKAERVKANEAKLSKSIDAERKLF